MESKTAVELAKVFIEEIWKKTFMYEREKEALSHLISLAEKLEALKGSHILPEKKEMTTLDALGREGSMADGHNACREEMKMRIVKNFGEIAKIKLPYPATCTKASPDRIDPTKEGQVETTLSPETVQALHNKLIGTNNAKGGEGK